MLSEITICDPRDGDHPHSLDFTPDLAHIENVGFMHYRGELREVEAVHRTRNGVQIQLLRRYVYA